MTDLSNLPEDNVRSSPGVRGELLELTSAFSSLLSTRIELARLEYVEARRQTLSQMFRCALAVLFLGTAFLVANALLIANYWDTPYRVTVMGWMIAVYAVLGLLTLWRLSALRRRTSRPFSATLEEFKKDRQWLKAAMASKQPETTPPASVQESRRHD